MRLRWRKRWEDEMRKKLVGAAGKSPTMGESRKEGESSEDEKGISFNR